MATESHLSSKGITIHDDIILHHHYLPHPPPPIGGGEGPLPWLILPSLRGPPGPGLQCT